MNQVYQVIFSLHGIEIPITFDEKDTAEAAARTVIDMLNEKGQKEVSIKEYKIIDVLNKDDFINQTIAIFKTFNDEKNN
jgi:hypothetical protein